MRKLLTGLMLVIAMLACRTSDDNHVATNRSNTNLPMATPSPSQEKSFSFVAQGQKTITGHIYPNAQKPKGKMVLFTPLLDKSDGNLYNASLHS